MTDLINKELNRCAERLSKNEPGSESYEKLLSCIERLRYIEGMIPAGAPTWVGCGETAEPEENGETEENDENGAPTEAQQSGFSGERSRSGMSEVSPSGGSEGYEACDDAAPEAEAAGDTTEPEWTKTAVREVLAEAKLAGVSVASILPRFNATRLSEVDPSRYGELVAAVRQEMA